MINNDREYILCAAVWFHDGIRYNNQPLPIEEGFTVCGRRHDNCYISFTVIRGVDIKTIEFPDSTMGFLTNLNRFIKRDEAGVLAYLSGQIDKVTECLFSEDLY